MPPGDGTTEDDYPTRVPRAVAGYVRGQLLFSLAMGAGAGIGLWLFGVLGHLPATARPTRWPSAIFFGLMELIPYVGPILGAIPPILVALFQDPLTALWVALLFVALQQIEGHVVAPQIFGHTLRINPLFVIFALLLGAEVYGIVGALLALPIAAVLRETVVYLAATSCSSPGARRSRSGCSPPPAGGPRDMPGVRRAGVGERHVLPPLRHAAGTRPRSARAP